MFETRGPVVLMVENLLALSSKAETHNGPVAHRRDLFTVSLKVRS